MGNRPSWLGDLPPTGSPAMTERVQALIDVAARRIRCGGAAHSLHVHPSGGDDGDVRRVASSAAALRDLVTSLIARRWFASQIEIARAIRLV